MATTTPASRSTAPTEDDEIFGPPPVLENEDFKAYWALLKQCSQAVRPKDFLEKIWVRDAADLTWEVFRWRRLIKEVLDSNNIGMGHKFDRAEQIDRLAMLAETRRNAALREIERHREIFAQTLRQKISEIETAGYRVIEHKDTAKAAAQKNAA